MTPADSYREAFNSHRHYDNMANATVALACIVIGASIPLIISLKINTCLYAITSLSTSIIIFLCTKAYKRFDSHAALALNVASAIEQGDNRFEANPIGFATVFASIDLFSDLKSGNKGRTLRTVQVIGYTFAILMLIAFAFSLMQILSNHTFFIVEKIAA